MKDVVITNDITKGIQRFVEKKESQPRSSFKTSELTQCPRRMCLRCNNKVKVRPLKEANKEYCVKKWVKLLSDLHGIEVLDSDISVCDKFYHICDLVDIVADINDKRYIIHIEPVDSERFKKIKESGPTRKDVVDINAKMWLLQIEKSVIIYESDLNVQVYSIKPYQPIIDSVKSKLKRIIDFQVAGGLPDRPYPNFENQECINCEYMCVCL